MQRKASAKRRPASECHGDAAEAPEESSERPSLHLSRLAKNLRDAADKHPDAQGPLLEFLTEHWGQQPRSATPTRDYEESFQSAANDQPYREDHAIDSSMYSEPEKIVLQAIQFLVTVRSGMPAKLPPGLPANATFKNLGKWGRFPTVKDLACVLCGKGTHPGSAGHTGENRNASAEEVHNWVENGVWVI